MSDNYPWGVIPPPPPDIIPPPEPPKENIVEEAEIITEEKKQDINPKSYVLVRGSGDPIYLIKDNRRHWVLNPTVLGKLGHKIGDEKKIEQSELQTYLPGEPITQDNWSKYAES